jgi:hypothetical protein
VLQSFKTAVEEAKEVLDIRAGRPPVTSHDPIDFLRPSTWPEGMKVIDTEKIYYPDPPTATDVEACSAEDVLGWYRDVTASLIVVRTCIANAQSWALHSLPRSGSCLLAPNMMGWWSLHAAYNP